MSYTSATFYLDTESGSDTARSALLTCVASNPAGSTTRINKTAHGLVTGAVVDLTLFTAWLNAAWKLTVFDADNFDLDGAVWQATADANGTVTPRGGSSKADAFLTFSTVAGKMAAGDTCRVKGSPSPTSLGINGTWTNGPLAATIVPTSSTNATPIVMTKSGHGLATGDTIIVNGHTTNTKANGVWDVTVSGNDFTLLNADGTNSVGNGVGGATGTFRKITNCRVKLASALTKNIALCGNQGTKTNWTAITSPGVNVCTVITSDFKEGGECQQIAVAAAHTTGLAAFFATGTLDLSSYQQVTFWVKQTSGTVAIAGDASIRLCTAVDGTSSVHTVAIPALAALNQWVPVTVDLTTNLNAAVASVALYIDTDRGAQTFLLDNILAVKAAGNDSLSLISLIGKNTGTETWCAIQSINSTRVMLDKVVNTIPAASPQRGYTGTTETVTAYKRETFATTLAASATATVVSISPTGTSGNVVTYSGGWDRTAMTTQNLETWFDGRNGFGRGFLFATKNYMALDKISTVRYGDGIYVGSNQSTELTITGGHHNNNTSNGVDVAQGVRVNVSAVAANYNGTSGALFDDNGGVGTNTYQCGIGTLTDASGNGSHGVNTQLSVLGYTADTITRANNNGGTGVLFQGGTLGVVNGRIKTITAANDNATAGVRLGESHNCEVQYIGAANNNGTYGLDLGSGGGHKIGKVSTSGNTTAGVGFTAATAPSYIRSGTFADSTPVATASAKRDSRLCVSAYGGVVGDSRIFTDGGSIVSQTAVRYSGTGQAWQFSPTSADRNIYEPLNMHVAQIAVAASSLVTVSARMRRSNTGLTFGLLCKGRQIEGVDSDVQTLMTAVADTWELVTITFTPTEAGVVQVEAFAYGGTTYSGYIDDLTVSQA